MWRARPQWVLAQRSIGEGGPLLANRPRERSWLGVSPKAHHQCCQTSSNHSDKKCGPMQDPRKPQVGSDIMEGKGVSGGLPALPRHKQEHDDGEYACETLQTRYGSRCIIVDDIDNDILVAQENCRQPDIKRKREEQLNQIIDTPDRLVEDAA